ncbi:MAG: hypothetical protein CL760_11800 [Chloroflexi bacterium]|nr:hypothetical protein [Chloroflexota bacterium]|tara:strand:+ start:72646 stop:73251 length:606 start_codon:yes stop_codon:yes gene_type:complete
MNREQLEKSVLEHLDVQDVNRNDYVFINGVIVDLETNNILKEVTFFKNNLSPLKEALSNVMKDNSLKLKCNDEKDKESIYHKINFAYLNEERDASGITLELSEYFTEEKESSVIQDKKKNNLTLVLLPFFNSEEYYSCYKQYKVTLECSFENALSEIYEFYNTSPELFKLITDFKINNTNSSPDKLFKAMDKFETYLKAIG